MNLSFLQDQPLNTVIVNSTDGKPFYEIQTPWKLGRRTTSIRRAHPAGHGQIVAEVDWHAWGSSQISFLGSSMRLDDFLPQDGMWSDSRTLAGSDGRLYKWTNNSNKLTLIDVQTKGIVAQSHRNSGGWFSTPRKMNIDIHPQGMQILDIVVVSFIVLEEKLRQRKRGVSAAIAGSTAG